MLNERKKGLSVSAAGHVLLLILMIFGLPSWMMPKPPEEPVAITVELLPITGVTNVKPAEKPPAPESKKEEPKPEEKKPSPPVKTEEPAPPPPPKDDPTKVKDIKKPEPKKEEKKPEEKKKPKEDDLDAVLKAVKKTAQEQKKDDEKKPDKTENSADNKSMSNQYDPTKPMSMSEKDAIRSQFARCWSVPAGAKDAQDLKVVLEISVEMDGTVTKVELADVSKSRYGSDTFYRAAADSAMRAVRQCSPLKDLPTDKYSTWKFMELTFDPKEMLL